MRKSFDGLHALVRDYMELDAASDGRPYRGFGAKRLEEGTYAVLMGAKPNGANGINDPHKIARFASRSAPVSVGELTVPTTSDPTPARDGQYRGNHLGIPTDFSRQSSPL
jgi:hypothetical protein